MCEEFDKLIKYLKEYCALLMQVLNYTQYVMDSQVRLLSLSDVFLIILC